DDVAAGFPERLAGLDHSQRLALQLEDHFALEDVAETRPARVAGWRGGGVGPGGGGPPPPALPRREQEGRGGGAEARSEHSVPSHRDPATSLSPISRRPPATGRTSSGRCGCIGFLNELFYGLELYRRTGKDVNSVSG